MLGRIVSILRKVLKWIAIVLFGIIVLLVIIIFVIRTSWAQQAIIDRVTAYVSGKTKTRIEVEKLFITFGGDVHLEGLYVEDLQGDTLLYAGNLEAGVAIFPTLRGNLNISKVELSDLVATIERDKDSIFNFNFIIDAFAGEPKADTLAEKKDSTALPKIVSGPVVLNNLRVKYRDEIIGMDARLKLGSFNMNSLNLDLQILEIRLDELELKDVDGELSQWLSTKKTNEEDTSSTTLPFISFNSIKLDNINLAYNSVADSLEAAVNLGSLAISKSRIDLDEQDITVKGIILKNTIMMAHLPTPGKDNQETEDKIPAVFVWPAWKLKLNTLELADNSVELKIGRPAEIKGKFNPLDMQIKGLTLNLEDVSLEDKKASLKMNEFSFAEKSGFELNQLAFELKLDDKKAKIAGLNLTTPNNFLKTDIVLTYLSPDSLVQNILSTGFDIDLEQADLNIEDAFYFAPELRKDTFIQSISAYPLSLQGRLSGKLDDVQVKKLHVSWLNSLELSMNGRVKGLPDTSKIEVDIPDLRLSLLKKDLLVFVKESEGGPVLPDTMSLQTKLKGNVKDLDADLAVQTNLGNVKLVANLKDIMRIPSAKGNLVLTDVNVNKLAAVPDLDPVSLTLEFDGSGNALDNITLEATMEFEKLTYRNYDYSNLGLKISAADQKARVDMQHRDDNLDFTLLVNALLDTLNPEADLDLNLKGADLGALGVGGEKIKLGADVKASFKGNGTAFKSSLHVENGVIIKQSDVYRFRPIVASLDNAPDSTGLKISSDIVNGHLTANTSIDKVTESLTKYITRLASADSLRAGLMNDSLDVTAHFTVNNSMLLKEVFLPDLVQMDSLKLDLEFHPSQNQLSLDFNAPKIIYAGYTLDSLGLHAAADARKMEGGLGFRQFSGGPIHIYRTKVDFGFENKILQVQLAVQDSAEEKLAVIGMKADVSRDNNTLVSIVPEGLILNSKPWTVPADNQLTISDKGTLYSNVALSEGSQQLKIVNDPEGNPAGMKIIFKDFELSTFTTILSTNDSLMAGRLNGNLLLTDMKTSPGIEADISLDNLALMGNDVGQLKLKANNRERNKYDIDLSLKGEAIDLETKGAFLSSSQPSLDLKLDLNRVDMVLLERFASGQLKNSSGSINAHCDISGPISDIKYKGYLAFKQASSNIAAVNAQFTLPDDRIEISDDGLIFKGFDLTDVSGRKTTIDGTVDTRNMLNPAFDLKITASNFQLLNSTRTDNDLFYGKAFVDLDIKAGGTLSLPRINAKAKLRKGSNITFIVPESEAAIQERRGLVKFKDMKDTLNTILVAEEEIETSMITGIDLTGYFEIDKETVFQIVIDERSGDKLQVEGEAKLNVEITPNGVMTLSGIYEVAGGSYDMNFYGLAKRKFELISGSRISWSGDPLSGELDLNAKYTVKTSAGDLMADKVQGGDNKYRQELPFEVMLNIDGQLMKPVISFAMDMPENSRTALGGNVYKRVQQLNESESELNKQVFSLIVLNRFIPDAPADESGNVSEDIARSSASKLLSGQLNAYSSKYLKGVELNVDLNTYKDYSSGGAENRTDLDLSVRKALFKERVVVQVGSQVMLEGSNKSYEASDIIGDVSLEYLITKEGRYRLKAFRRNQFQDLVEGQIVVTGLSVLFSKDFDDFKDLVAKTPKVKEDKEKEQDKDEEKDKEKEEEKK